VSPQVTCHCRTCHLLAPLEHVCVTTSHVPRATQTGPRDTQIMRRRRSSRPQSDSLTVLVLYGSLGSVFSDDFCATGVDPCLVFVWG